ncbi:PepSY domain-containing protein [Marinilongibacter aquaticus]|uniref:PepSY-associated TM helix domain-containing protein n=1 Tax=Marinilongibacter aquaticus TaxID=2975157 RepID=UPI0021BD2FAA|nr:PepSY-associated TM helix domain-containing protein [Marinilongibacter aquaticus]UBM58731.1 PepSY domain-containing protein [Marinilongibacter aquaticus]
MKLKGLKARAYNIMFHVHTVSGIVLSVVLFVIFYAGAFTLFKSEFNSWENPQMRGLAMHDLKISKVLSAIESQTCGNVNWNEDVRIAPPRKNKPAIGVFGHLNTAGPSEGRFDFLLNPLDYTPIEAKGTVGETLFRLHFLDQIPAIGRYLAGFVSLFFLFASLTGLLIHWRNIFTKFWSFSLKGAKKQFWANAHTVMGFLGLPFQLMYAVTGAFYLLLPLILLPAVGMLYAGNVNSVYKIVYPSYGIAYSDRAEPAENLDNLEALYSQVLHENPDLEITYIGIKNFNRKDGTVNFSVRHKSPESFDNSGSIGYRLSTRAELYSQIPQKNKGYVQQVINGMGQLHFATFGGLLLKSTYFILALLTCFMVLAGVVLWREARQNKSFTVRQKHFHSRTTTIYLAICLSLIPAVPLLFASELIVPASQGHKLAVNTIFFTAWLILGIFGVFLKKDRLLVHWYLFLSALFSLSVPLSNGYKTGYWPWISLLKKEYGVALTDAFWLCAGLFQLFLFLYAIRKTAPFGNSRVNRQSAPSFENKAKRV